MPVYFLGGKCLTDLLNADDGFGNLIWIEETACRMADSYGWYDNRYRFVELDWGY